MEFYNHKHYPQNDPRFSLDIPSKEAIIDHAQLNPHGINVNNGALELHGGDTIPPVDPRFDKKDPPWAAKSHTHKRIDITDFDEHNHDDRYWKKTDTTLGWLKGQGVPTTDLGVNGNFYINTLNEDVYYKSFGYWDLTMNIKGPQGPQGIPGEPGPQGEQGIPGQDGTDGQDGFSPSASVTKVGATTTITITDKDGTTTASVTDGAKGDDGEPGVGVVAGGTTGQVLAKKSNTNYDTEWIDQSGSVTSVNGQTGVVVLDSEDVGAIKEPTVEGTSGQVLTTDGDGGRTWTTVSSGGAVSSVNGKVGAVVLNASDVGAQATLVSGTNIKTINNQSILGSGNLSLEEIFIAEYDVTTMSEIYSEYQAGKLLFATKNGVLYTLLTINSNLAWFTTLAIDTDLNVTQNILRINQSGWSDISQSTNIPTKTSDLTNDSGFIDNTYHDATKVDVVSGKGLSTNDYDNTEKGNVASNTSARHTHSNKTILDNTTASYTTAEQTKLDGIEAGANNYVLPNATTSTLGGIKPDGTTCETNNGVLSVIGGGGPDITISSVDIGEGAPLNSGALYFVYDE